MIDYGKSRRKDLPALTVLWERCFGDAPADTNDFWDALFDSIGVFCAYVDGIPAAGLCTLPATLTDDCGEEQPAAYLYAVCTAPEYRRRGLCAGLTAYAERALAEKGCAFAALVPAEEALFDFYRKLGYKTAFYHKKYTIPAADCSAKCTCISADAYRNLRQMQLYSSSLDFPPVLLQWQQHVCEHSGAGLYRVETAQKICCIAAVRDGTRLLCKELLPDVPEAAAALAAKLGCTEALVCTVGDAAPFGMIKALRGDFVPERAYLGLALD